jgi:hypothetical protein
LTVLGVIADCRTAGELRAAILEGERQVRELH